MAVSVRSGLSPVRTPLDNGAVIIVKETRKTPAVALTIAVRAGSICDPADAPGAMHLLARVIDRGTAARSAEEIAEELDARGISLSVTVNRHQLSATCTCLADDFGEVFALVGEILMAPSIPEAELTTRKGEVVTAIRQDDENPGVRAVEGLMAMLYGDSHPYGRRQKGTIESVDAISRDRLLSLHAARFAPSELTAVIVGDVDARASLDVARRVFGDWKAATAPPVSVPAPGAPTARRRLVLPMMNKAQADIAYGFTAVGRRDPAYYAFWLMNNALGQYALGGRLGDNIRERQGMAYYVSSILDANVVPGPLLIRAGVSPANVDRALAAIDQELSQLRAEGLTLKELTESRQYLIGAMPRALETNAGIANFLQSAEFFGLGLDYDLQLPGLLRAVTLDDANAAARRVLDPDRATVVIAGPYQEK
jgi:zinc protease